MSVRIGTVRRSNRMEDHGSAGRAFLNGQPERIQIGKMHQMSEMALHLTQSLRGVVDLLHRGVLQLQVVHDRMERVAQLRADLVRPLRRVRALLGLQIVNHHESEIHRIRHVEGTDFRRRWRDPELWICTLKLRLGGVLQDAAALAQLIHAGVDLAADAQQYRCKRRQCQHRFLVLDRAPADAGPRRLGFLLQPKESIGDLRSDEAEGGLGVKEKLV